MKSILTQHHSNDLRVQPAGFGVHQSAGALFQATRATPACTGAESKAPEDWRTPRRCRAQARPGCHGGPLPSSILAPAALLLLCFLCISSLALAQTPQPPTVTGVTVAQRASTDPPPKYVDISYTISDANFTAVNIFLLVSTDSAATWNKVIPQTFISGSAIGTNVPVTTSPAQKTITWDAGTDWDGNFTTHCRVRVLANNVGLVLIPAGSYLRGNPPGLGDSDITDAPQYSVYVSAFYMDANLVSGGLWVLVKAYADANGYTFVHAGSFKASSHPIQTVDWYDAVKWCNARSQREGLTPVYYTDAGFTTVYKSGEAAPYWKPGANGYRLPTEAEWEKAARGGATGHRFPWSDADTISESRANYLGNDGSSYDLGPNGFNATYATGVTPYYENGRQALWVNFLSHGCFCDLVWLGRGSRGRLLPRLRG